jgi:hypothetical protein
MAEALVRLLFAYTQLDVGGLLNNSEEVFLAYRKNHGKAMEITYRKLIFVYVRRYYTFQPPLYTGKPIPGMKLDRSGFPVRFLFLKFPGFRKDPNRVRCVLSILSLYRVMTACDWSSKSITTPRTRNVNPLFEERIIDKGIES